MSWVSLTPSPRIDLVLTPAQLLPSLPSLPGWSRSTPASSSTAPPSSAHEDVPDEDDLDVPPPFPLPNSAQRSQAPSRASAPSPSLAISPPSPPRVNGDDEAPSDLNIAILPGPIPLGDMAPPPSTTKKPDFGIQPGGMDTEKHGNGVAPTMTTTTTSGLGVAAKTAVKSKGKKGKVALAPGHSALDWARLTQSGKNIRGTDRFPLRVTMEELKRVSRIPKLVSTKGLLTDCRSITRPTTRGPYSMERSTTSRHTSRTIQEGWTSSCVWRVGTERSCSVSDFVVLHEHCTRSRGWG
jgi:hypothetical protein